MSPKIALPLFLIALLISGGILFWNNPFSNILGTSTGPIKSSYTIVVFGDSMVDTMGENMDYLYDALKRHYPNTNFKLLNFGIGSQNVEMGYARFKIPLNYKTRNYDSVTQINPDIIILGSFGYNVFTPHDRDRHWLGLSKLIQEAKNSGSDVYQLVEIAPLKDGFGKGPGGVNYEESLAREHSKKIVEQLENALYLARDHHKIPVINAYSKSLVDGKFGQKRFVDPNDGIHPSIVGHKMMAEMIASKLKLK